MFRRSYVVFMSCNTAAINIYIAKLFGSVRGSRSHNVRPSIRSVQTFVELILAQVSLRYL